MTPSLTIAVCTRERPGKLRGLLAAVEPLRRDGVEILVVDNAPRDDSTRRVTQEFRVSYVVEPVPGASPARQRALTAAAGELIAYLDDDSRPAPGWMDALVAGFEDCKVGIVVGAILPTDGANAVQRAFQSYSCRCGGDAREIGREDVGNIVSRCMQGSGANMAFRRDALARAGGFPRFAVSAEDDYIFFKMVDAGYRLRYEPGCIVYQQHRDKMSAQLARFREYGRDEMRIARYLAEQKRSHWFFLLNFGNALRTSARRMLRSVVHLRWRHLAFEIWHVAGLITGALLPGHFGREMPIAQAAAIRARHADASSAGGKN